MINFKINFSISCKICLQVKNLNYWKKELKGCLKTLDLDTQIKDIFEDSRETYGSPRIYKALLKLKVEVRESTVARRMRALRLTPIIKKNFKATTNSNHDKWVYPNILDRAFNQTELGRVWVSDITYIRVSDSFVYLTTIIDLADRMVIGWDFMR